MKKFLSPTLYRVSALLLIVFCLPGTLLLHVRAGNHPDTPAVSILPDGGIVKTGFQEAGVEAVDTQVQIAGNVTAEKGYGIYASDSAVSVAGDIRGDDIGIMIADDAKGSMVTVSGDVEGGIAGISVARESSLPTDLVPETVISVDGDVTGSGVYNYTKWRGPVQSAGVIADIEGYLGLDISGDVTAATKEGSGIYLAFDTQEAQADVRVDGTVSGSHSGITVYYPVDAETASEQFNRPQLCVWEIENDGGRFVTVEGNGNGDYDAIAETILGEIDYIIRSAPLDNGSLVINATPKGDDLVGRQGEEITLAIIPDEGYMIDHVSGGKATIRLNDDGSYTLLVPMGGGVDITAVLKAIEAGEKEVAVAAAPSPPSEDTEESVQAPEEKNVTNSGTKPESSTVITASTPDPHSEDEVTQAEGATVLGIRRNTRTGDRSGVWQVILLGMASGMYLASRKILKKHF